MADDIADELKHLEKDFGGLSAGIGPALASIFKRSRLEITRLRKQVALLEKRNSKYERRDRERYELVKAQVIENPRGGYIRDGR